MKIERVKTSRIFVQVLFDHLDKFRGMVSHSKIQIFECKHKILLNYFLRQKCVLMFRR